MGFRREAGSFRREPAHVQLADGARRGRGSPQQRRRRNGFLQERFEHRGPDTVGVHPHEAVGDGRPSLRSRLIQRERAEQRGVDSETLRRAEQRSDLQLRIPCPHQACDQLEKNHRHRRRLPRCCSARGQPFVPWAAAGMVEKRRARTVEPLPRDGPTGGVLDSRRLRMTSDTDSAAPSSASSIVRATPASRGEGSVPFAARGHPTTPCVPAPSIRLAHLGDPFAAPCADGDPARFMTFLSKCRILSLFFPGHHSSCRCV